MKKKKGYPILGASVLGADLLHMERDLERCVKTGRVSWVQVDVMDWAFAPNLSFGPDIVAAIKKKFPALYIDVHLMVDRPKAMAPAFAQKGANLITVHLESRDKAVEALALIRKLGLSCGLAIKPKTPIERVRPFLKQIDLILPLSVEPGFSGQNFIPGVLDKVRAARAMISSGGRKIWLQADGGVNEATIPGLVAAGADILVCASALFKDHPKVSVGRLERAIESGMAKKTHASLPSYRRKPVSR